MVLQYGFKVETIIREGRTSTETLDKMKQWLSNQPLPEVPDELVVLFLLSCENDVSLAQTAIASYFRIKNGTPELFDDRDVSGEILNKALTVASLISIPVRMDDNIAIHFFKLIDTNYRNMDLVPLLKLSLMLVDVTQRYNPPNGIVVIMDMVGVGVMHLTRMKIGAVKAFLEFIQEGMPLKIRMIHVINTNYIFDKILALVRIFIKSELMSIIRTHPPGADIEEIVPSFCLPQEYGGSLPCVEELTKETIEQFTQLKQFFMDEELLRRK